MVVSYLPLLGIYTLLFLWILGFTYFFRKRITCMMGMMIAMTLGMTSGLGVGTVIGMALPQQFFQASVSSMMIGAMVGAIAGFPISFMAILDGLLSGLMGGMMGVMFVVMVPPEYLNSVIKIMAVISAGILFILFLTTQGEVEFKEKNWKTFFFGKPQPLFLVVCLFLFMVHQVQVPSAKAETNHIDHQMNTSEQTNNGSPAQSGKKVTETKSLQLVIEASEFKFSPGTLKVRPGETVTLVLKNNGKIEHDFEIQGTNIHVHAGPGSKDSTSFALEKPGTYKAICTLPGHQEAGMVSIVEVG
jgi:plastocyanin